MSTSTPEVAGPCEGFRSGEVALLDPDEKWFRACPQHLWDEEYGGASTKMFGLSTGDGGQLSGTRSAVVDAAFTYDYQVHGRHKAVAEVRALKVGDLAAESLHVHDDSALIPLPPASPHGHAFLDMRHLPSGKSRSVKLEREQIRARLMDLSRIAHPSAA